MDIWISFRDTSLKNYGLEPAHYYSAPGLSFDAMLKMTKVEISLITKPDIYQFFEKQIRGGISTSCNLRYAKAENTYISIKEKEQEEIKSKRVTRDDYKKSQKEEDLQEEAEYEALIMEEEETKNEVKKEEGQKDYYKENKSYMEYFDSNNLYGSSYVLQASLQGLSLVKRKIIEQNRP